MFWNWRFKTCVFLKEFHGMCKHCPLVVLHILLQYVYNFFEQCKTFFVNFYIRPLPFHPFSCFINLPFPFCSPCSKFQQILQGSSKVGSFGYSKGFVVISHILYSIYIVHFASSMIMFHSSFSSMYKWQNIPPCHDILYAMCKGIFFQYSFEVNRIFQKIILVHLFMLPCSPFNIPRFERSCFLCLKFKFNHSHVYLKVKVRAFKFDYLICVNNNLCKD